MSGGFFRYENDPDPHKGLGVSRERPDQCSICDAEIGEAEVPLILWADGGGLMWCYCKKCEPRILAACKIGPKT